MPPAESRSRLSLLGGVTELWSYGPQEADTTVIAVHGFRGDHHGLLPLVSHLRTCRVVVPDLPGFGRSTPLGGETDAPVVHDIDGYSAWLVALVRAVRQERPGDRIILLGHSFGSIVVAAAFRRRLGVDGVVLISPISAPALKGPRGALTRLVVFYYRVGAWLPERLGFAWLRLRLVTRIMSVVMTKTPDRALRRWIHHQHRLYFGAFSNRRVVLDAFRASVGNTVSQYAHQIAPPTLVIASDNDDITPLAAQRALVSSMPDARLVVLAGVGHLLHYEMPARAAAEVHDFLREVA